jgi:acetyltransferase-like isoleucine patch superfamily enzyme
VLANASQETAVMRHRSNIREPFADPISHLARALTKLYSIWASLTYPFASIGNKVSVHYTCRLARSRAHQIKIGNEVFIGKDVWLNVSALEEKDEPVLVIDDGAIVNNGAQISAKNLIHIEQDVLISTGVLIQDHSHAYEDVTKPISKQGITEGGRIRIEQGSWIGRGAAVLCAKGELVIGRNCVVAANAVVLRSCPPYSVVFGNPAIVIRRYDFSKNKWVLGSSAAADSQVDQ